MTDASETPEQRSTRLAAERQLSTKNRLKKDVGKINAVSGALLSPIDPAREIAEFREFCENVEDGWVEWTTEQNDPPYGRDRDRRPLIRNITANTTKDPG